MLSQPAHIPRHAGRLDASASQRAQLQRSLLSILEDETLAHRPEAKRTSIELLESEPKRPRSRSGRSSLDQNDAVDSIPVRSSVGPPETPPPLTPPRFQTSIRSYFYATSSTARSTPTSKSSSFRSHAETGMTISKNTSFSEDYDPYPACTQERRILDEVWDASEPALSSDPITPSGATNALPATSNERLRWCMSHTILRNTLNADNAIAGLTCPTLGRAPLAVLWEVTRIAQHCGVQCGDLSDLKYEPNEMWHDQSKLRKMLACHHLFKGKAFPPPSDSRELRREPNFSEQVIRWLTQDTHHLCGRDWASFYTSKPKRTMKSSKGKPFALQRIHFFAVGGANFQTPHTRGSIPPGDDALRPECRTEMKLSSLLEWTVGIQHNAAEQVAKLFTRIALTTVTLAHRQIQHRHRDLGEAPHVMNDGAARMSRSLAKGIADHLGLDATPAAYQGRFGCAKGMWIVDVQDDGLDDDYWIETYPSQRKWKCPFEDPLHRTFEVKDWSRELRTAALNQQFIPVLESCAVNQIAMRNAIASHLTSSLRMEIDAGKTALAHPIDMRRWLRQFGGSSERKSLISFMGGLPSADEDAVAFLLDAGFDQRHNCFVQDLCVALVRKKMEQLKSKMHVRVPQSTYLFMIPDFWGILDENEVHVSFSNRFHVDGFSDTLLEDMDILVGRSPAHLASDIQRVRVVSHPTLRKLKDVIVMSTKGTMSLAEKLSGGDYDGDKAWVCWDRKIVDIFCNSPVPAGLKVASLVKKQYLEKMDMTVKSLTTRPNVEEMCTKFVSLAFSFHMEPTLLGIVTNYKEKLSYHQDSIIEDKIVWLSNFLSHLVDQGKQGIKFSQDHWTKVRKEQLQTPLHLDDPDYALERRVSKPSKLRRPNDHILDHLKFNVGVPAIGVALTDFEKSIKGKGGQLFDADLTKRFNEFEKECETWEEGRMILGDLRQQLDTVAMAYGLAMAQQQEGGSDYAGKIKHIHQLWMGIVPGDVVLSSPRVGTLMEEWVADPGATRWALLKASVTFKMFYRQAPKFVWRIAGRQLCELKRLAKGAQSGSSYAFVNPEMYAILRPGKSFTTHLAARENASEADEAAAETEDLYDECDWLNAYE
ncbi:Acyl-coenzyme A thioesterase 13 [Purpureocillium lavendulum]|uniref:RNA-dependent RNA polymerase n=1 Tax=Purpureocillium lavendulum TaxID=1247861 RepID=A0AB34G6K6_9HYPO|nr:Acyl-coenzyme A thioesterase 13 [Purpureocillium lavendulum]